MVKKGFTLLELLIVVGLIGILIAIAVTSYGTIQKKSRDSRRMSDLKGIQNALEQYYADNNGQYPTAAYTTLVGTYFPGTAAPTDPKTDCSYHQTDADADAYTICADLETTGTYDCTAACAGCADDYCVTNLQ